MDSFGARLHEVTRQRGALCVGIDPHASLLGQWGLPDDADGLARFVRTVIDALAEQVAVFKPQVAFFERFGSHGVAVLESAIRQLRSAGALVLLDAKRGDIGSTVAAYAAAYLEPASPLSVDAVTASPYLGVGALSPMVEAARAHGRGMFVLARTSNPDGGVVQEARIPGAGTVAQHVVDELSQLNEDFLAAGDPLGSFGVVVGATLTRTGLDLSRLGGPILAPGLGEQGATPAELPGLFGAQLPAVLPSYSRTVLGAGPSGTSLRESADRALADCTAAGVVPGGR